MNRSWPRSSAISTRASIAFESGRIAKPPDKAYPKGLILGNAPIMIRYMLKCSKEHQFESWFRSAEAFETLCKNGQLSCPTCGTSQVFKAMMAPRVSTARKPELPATEAPASASPTQTSPMEPPRPTAEDVEQAVAKLRADVEANSDYVGVEFAKEARKIHEGEAPARAIYGEAKLDDAKALLEEGVPVLPLPFTPKRKLN